MADYPAMPLFTDAYLGDTTHLSTWEHGAYLLMLMTAWRSADCGLPNDDKQLGRIVRDARGWGKYKQNLLVFWFEKDGRLYQKKQLELREIIHAKRIKAQHAAHAKHMKNKETTDANASAKHMPQPANHNHNHNQGRSSGGGNARVAPEFYTQVQGLINSPVPLKLSPLQKWLDAGATEAIILEVITELMAQRQNDPPTSIVYFEKAVARAVKESQQPMRQDDETTAHTGRSFGGNGNHTGKPRGAAGTKSERAKEALMRAAERGGYAPKPGADGFEG